jgi:hypothetical protein
MQYLCQDREERSEETDCGFAETKKLVDSIGKQIGDVNNKFGRLSEEMVVPSLRRVLTAGNTAGVYEREKRRAGDLRRHSRRGI